MNPSQPLQEASHAVDEQYTFRDENYELHAEINDIFVKKKNMSEGKKALLFLKNTNLDKRNTMYFGTTKT